MKNLLKFLNVSALAFLLTMNVLNVNAEEFTCAEDEVMHTNYYLFLEVNSVDFYEDKISNMPEGENFVTWNGAYKYNDIQYNSHTLREVVPITKGEEATCDGTNSWTVEEFWKKYYYAKKGANENLVYTVGNESYFLHDKWWSYDKNFQNGVERYASSTLQADYLLDRIEGNLNNLNNISLITTGTSVPTTNVEEPSGLGSSNATTLHWRISRTFLEKDILSGVTINGEKVIYSPAAHAVKYCVKKVVNKTITYDENTSDTVTNMPSNTSFTEECTDISDLVPVRNGYTFLGWSTDATATTADSKYASGSEYCGDSIVLHAIWAPVTSDYTITYDANGGINAPAKQTAKAGVCTKISTEKPTHGKHNFLGWSTNKKATEPDPNFDGGDEYCGAQGNVTLYAVWNIQTGINTHLVMFTGIALTAGVALIVAKKKDLFRQI